MPIPVNHAKPARQSAKESAFSQIQQWIIEGTLMPGEKLNDAALAEALGVSRTPIRESLQLLEVQDFVKMYPGRATQGTDIEKESINDLLPPLASLQALSAELAISQLTEAVISSLEEINGRFAEAIRSENYFDALKIDEEFHQMIVETASNPYINHMLSYLQAHVRRLFFHNSIILTKSSIDEHDTIIKLMKEHNRKEVSEVMRKNWLRAIEEFRTFRKK